MNDKIGKMGSAWVWLFALGAVLFGMGSGYVTAGMSAKISSGVYFGVFIVSGFAAMALTQAKAWLGIAAFLLAALVCMAMERRRLKRAQINRVGWMPWTGLFLVFAVIGGGLLAVAIPGIIKG